MGALINGNKDEMMTLDNTLVTKARERRGRKTTQVVGLNGCEDAVRDTGKVRGWARVDRTASLWASR